MRGEGDRIHVKGLITRWSLCCDRAIKLQILGFLRLLLCDHMYWFQMNCCCRNKIRLSTFVLWFIPVQKLSPSRNWKSNIKKQWRIWNIMKKSCIWNEETILEMWKHPLRRSVLLISAFRILTKYFKKTYKVFVLVKLKARSLELYLEWASSQIIF